MSDANWPQTAHRRPSERVLGCRAVPTMYEAAELPTGDKELREDASIKAMSSLGSPPFRVLGRF